ncbi:hypothetical protein [Ruegeria arenilitoris]|uniref:hypothetical protein n=1 Tax=Ruegeria arenilitoris TaxID=1173585 RepID=UPI0034641B7B
MLELIFAALITIVPDYLYRRYGQGKRWGHEITLFNIWYELRCWTRRTVPAPAALVFHDQRLNGASEKIRPVQLEPA